jgi:hypothetical protein
MNTLLILIRSTHPIIDICRPCPRPYTSIDVHPLASHVYPLLWTFTHQLSISTSQISDQDAIFGQFEVVDWLLVCLYMAR